MPEDRDSVPQDGSVTPERFARVRAIFEAALERAGPERRAYAAGACAGDGDLLREVEAMLAAEGEPHPLFDGAPAANTPEEGRFPAGTVLAGRYRILGLLGKGGMGEVYRVHDVILNQTVALKFLTPANLSEAALVRFRHEVRIARQVSHPNVCRVYDLGMVEGLHFLSMEYIDGEDLASLLRRIGRLPQDKALEFTRKICAGLAAAHERSVLHRDLKPSNIMIDGRGQVRITDFGLAALAAEIPLSDLRSGTPAYMSPEQKAGQGVTTRSDIYSLGLVLHEMFTGKRRQDTRTNPSWLVKDLDPAIERLILRCLEEEPRRRPASALGAAMALPGGDPIAAALAAGETPSPEMIAASQEKEGFSRLAAILCFLGVVLSLVIGLWISEETSFLTLAPLPIPPDALADRAQQLLKTIGYSEAPQSSDYAFTCCDQQAIENLYRYPAARRAEILASHRPPIRYFQYHQHRTESLTPGVVRLDTLESSEAGMIFERLDAEGRLLRLDVRPWVAAAATSPADWATLFSAAGLDRGRFTSATPETVPPMSSDARLAWTGTYAEDRIEQVRVEAASWQGRPVFFEVQPFRLPGERIDVGSRASSITFLTLLLVSFIAGGLTAWRNLRQGRSDRRGAAVIAGAAFAMAAGAWALDTGHAASALEESLLIAAASWPVFITASFWLVYVALEPYVRRNWPDALISWTRLCNGQMRNPVVASHILAGIAAAEAFGLIVRPGFTLLAGGFSVLQLGVMTFSLLLGQSLLILAAGLAFALVAALIRQFTRKPLLADLVVAALFAVPAGFEPYGNGPVWVILSCCLFGAAAMVWIWLLRRFGFLTNLIVWLVQGIVLAWPLTVTGWFASRSLAVHLLPVAVAGWALWVILSVQKRPETESPSMDPGGNYGV